MQCFTVIFSLCITIVINYYAYLYGIIRQNYVGSDPLRSAEDILSCLLSHISRNDLEI